jgi:general secretion pathway protein D
MKYLLLLVLSTQVHAGLRIMNGEVLPFTNAKYPIKEFIKDYAELTKLNVTYASNLIKDKETVHIQLATKTTIAEFKVLFYESLANLGYTPREDHNLLWINNTREVRYLASPVYTDQSFPKDASYSTVIYKLKYPLSSEICRNMRPFLSRYGRVIDVSDARTILFHDRGDNTTRLLKTIENLDTEAAYKSILAYKPKKNENDENPLKEKVVELELEKKLIEKKYLELKGEQQ